MKSKCVGCGNEEKPEVIDSEKDLDRIAAKYHTVSLKCPDCESRMEVLWGVAK